MNAGDVMTRPVISVKPDTAIGEVARLMLQHRISGLPVVDESGAVVGMVTEGDLLRRVETGTERHTRWLEFLISPGRLARDYVDANARKAEEVMSTAVVIAAPMHPLEDVVRLMERHRIKRVPIVENGQLVGIVSRANLVRALVKALAKEPERAVGDEEIRTAILHAIDIEAWAPRSAIDVRVKDGIVDLSGTFTDERERTALQVLIENIPGVKVIRDHLVWTDSVSQIAVPH